MSGASLTADLSEGDQLKFRQLRVGKKIKQGTVMTSVTGTGVQTYDVGDLLDGGITRSGQSSNVNDVLPTANEFRNEMATRLGIGFVSLPQTMAVDFVIYNQTVGSTVQLQPGANTTLYGRNIVGAGRATKVKLIITINFGLVQAEAYMLYGHR